MTLEFLDVLFLFDQNVNNGPTFYVPDIKFNLLLIFLEYKFCQNNIFNI